MQTEISDEEFDVVRDFLEYRCGIFLQPNKKYLVQSRLEKLLKEFKVDSYLELIGLAKKNIAPGLLETIIDNMTTNETLWFRDRHPFVTLKELLLPMITAKKIFNKIRIWSGAASTGQEPYSIAMMIMDFCKQNRAFLPSLFEILATDISDSALKTARIGFYDQFKISRGLEEDNLAKYFSKKEDGWMVKDELRKLIRFQNFNLQKPFGIHGKFDLIFCRNVMIYFSSEFKKELMGKFHDALKSPGYLFLGATETILGLSNSFESVVHKRGVVYKKKE